MPAYSFYEADMEPHLRFGDVIKGYISINLEIKKPILSYKNEEFNYDIDIELPAYSVVLTPCCSIGESIITVAPLIHVYSDFFKNPYFANDLTNINREMEPHQSMPPSDWEKLSPEKKSKRIAEGRKYALLNYFIYGENDLFEKYSIRGHEISCHMVNFKDARRIKCQMIKRPEKMTTKDTPIIDSKVLQLSKDIRKQFLDKMAYFYRQPEEDMDD